MDEWQQGFVRGKAARAELLQNAAKALRPFAGCVFDDNGDVTVGDTFRITPSEWAQARRTYLKLTRELRAG